MLITILKVLAYNLGQKQGIIKLDSLKVVYRQILCYQIWLFALDYRSSR